MNNERVQPEQQQTQPRYPGHRKQFAERKNLTAARLEGHRRGERRGQRNGLVMGVVIGAVAVVTVLMLQGRVAF